MPLLFLIIYSIWLFSEILLNKLFRAKEKDQQKADKGSLILIWTIIIISNFLAASISNIYSFPISSNPLIRYLGLSLIIFGTIFRLYIVSSLGKFFTVDVTIKEDHKLKTDGFYKYLRHPSYFASLISFAGFGISLNNLLSLGIVMCLTLLAFLVRINIEEKVLIKHFGAEYLAYKQRTKAIIPFIY